KSEILFLFHGGEPSLLKNEWYETAISYAQEVAKRYCKRVKFSMQTNLFSVSAAKIDLFKKYNIHLGVSLDGVAHTAQTQRSGESKVFENYLRIKQAGLKAGILTTINHSNYNQFDKLCPWLVEHAQIKNFKANVVTPVGRGVEMKSLLPEQVFQAQKSIIDFMLATNGALIEENLRTEIIRFFEGRTEAETLCHEQQCGAGSKVLGITPQGKLLPCGRFQWNDTPFFLGSIQETQLADFESKRTEFHHLVPENWYNCSSCEAKKICGFGCQAFIVRSKQQANVDCLPTKMRFAYFKQKEKELRKLYKLIKQEAQHPKTPQSLQFRIKDENGNLKSYTLPLKKEKWFHRLFETISH
ncbi:MAG: radical SAM protein, partial [Flammeovirgaceae bacterium]